MLHAAAHTQEQQPKMLQTHLVIIRRQYKQAQVVAGFQVLVCDFSVEGSYIVFQAENFLSELSFSIYKSTQ